MSLSKSFLTYFNGNERVEDALMHLEDLRSEIEDLIEDIDGAVSARDRRKLQELIESYCVVYVANLKDEVLRSVDKLTVSHSLREILRLLEAIEKYQDRESEHKEDDTLLARAFKLSVRKNRSNSSEKDQSKTHTETRSKSDKDQETKVAVEVEYEEPPVAKIIYVASNGKYYQSRESAIKKGGGVKEATFLYIRGTEILKNPVPESEKKRLLRETFDIDF